MLYLFLRILIFDFFAAIFIAKLEIEIEGEHGWAENLPTRRIKNKLTKLLWGDQPYTGYHLWLFLSVLLFLHLPFFAFPYTWSPQMEAFLFGNYAMTLIAEDIFWFMMNPHYGLKKFNKHSARWHSEWINGIPMLYVKLGIFAVISLTISFF